MNKKLIGNIIGGLLILFALLPSNLTPNIPPIIPPSINLDIEQPTDAVLNIVDPISRSISNKDDRIKLAVFNYVFSNRILNYDTDVQKMQDVYVLASENFFQDSLRGKYDLSNQLTNLFISIVGEENHMLTKEEKQNLKEAFGGLAWRLIK
jgi:hypothetical protein